MDTTDSLTRAPKASFVEGASVKVAGNGTETEYILATGDVDFPMRARLGIYPKSGGVGRVNVSLRVTTYLQATDAEDAVVWTEELPLVISWTMPGLSGAPVASEMLTLLNFGYSLLTQLVAGAVGVGPLTQLGFGITTGILAFTDTEVP
jgi:small ligand-binding sensory domain FIST